MRDPGNEVERKAEEVGHGPKSTMGKSVYACSRGVRISDEATEDTLKAEFRSYFR